MSSSDDRTNTGNDIEADDEFWDMADSLIAEANQLCDKADPSKVGAALLYAAARFNAFIVASNSVDRKEFKAEKEEAMQYFSKQYRTMLGDNLADYEANFKDYTRKPNSKDDA